MPRILKPILTLITINSLAILFFSLQSYSNPVNRQLATIDSQLQSDNDLKFKDPIVAYQILTLLDIFEELKPEDPYGNVKVGVFDGLKLNDHYCEEHRAYFVSNPELVFEKQNYFCDYWTWHPLRTTVFPGIGTDLYPMISTGAPRRVKLGYLYDMRPDTNIFYSNLMMFERRVIGKHYSCLSQISNHIPGNGALYKKDEVGALLAEYSKQYTSRPECLSSEKFFPKTWVMDNEAQCLDFFSEFLSAKYNELKAERGIVYFRKISGVHEGQGVFPVTEQDEQFIRETYQDGRLCGQVQDKTLIQYSIYNPLLINGKKFDFRVFMLVASTNPLIAFYHDGYLRISLFDYDTNSEHKGSFITNTAISKKIFKLAEQNGTYNGRTADELKDMSYGFYDKLQSYLLEKGIIQDPNWKNNYLKPEIKKVMVHLLRLAQHKLLQRSSISQLFGVDLMMDENLNIWFIEANAIPMVKGWTEETKSYFNSMMTDHLEILFSLLKSRMKRVIHYVNSIIEAEGTWDMSNNTTFNLQYLEKRREEFRKISMNSFEPEFELSPSNKFEKILDENYEGIERYSGLLKAQCL